MEIIRRTRFLFILIICQVLLIKLSLKSQIIHIPDDQPTIQAGIDIAEDGDTVLVDTGTYFENINFNGKKIVVASHFIIENDHSIISSTIINGSEPENPDSASCVRFISNEDSTSVLEGFTITGGTGTIWPDIHIGGKYREGGGILIELASPTIKHNWIVENEAIDKSDPGVTSAGGGAIRCGDGNPKIMNNLIQGNQGLYGAGIVLNYSGGIIKNNIIIQNFGGQDFSGSGIWCYNNGPAPKIYDNNTIVGNVSTGSGSYGGKGGALMVWSTSISASNNIIWGNTQSFGNPIAIISATVNMTYSDVEGGFAGDGNLDIDPEFATTNYYLSPDSPCVDAGNSDAEYNDPEDTANPGNALWPALGDMQNDMGAYGGPHSALLQGSIVLDQGYINNNSSILNLGQNFPNPINKISSIEFSIPESGVVELMLYDIFGKKVAVLDKGFRTKGEYHINFEKGDLSPGLYFYCLDFNEKLITRKMLVN